MKRSWIRFWMNGWLRMSLIKKILNGIKRSGKKQALIWSKKLLMLNTHGIRSIVSIRREIISGNAWWISDISFQEWRLLYCLSSGFRKWEYLINSRKCWFEWPLITEADRRWSCRMVPLLSWILDLILRIPITRRRISGKWISKERASSMSRRTRYRSWSRWTMDYA